MGALEDLTGEPVEIGDLLEVVPDPEPEVDPGAEVDAESAFWLGAALTPVLEPWTWGPEGEPGLSSLSPHPRSALNAFRWL